MGTLRKLSKTDRQRRILAELRSSATIRISDLAGELGVSGETLRRDLLEMGKTGLISRTYGGAVARPFGFEPAWNERLNDMAEERRRIAACAAARIRPGEALMIDAGSTALHFARRLASDLDDLTVVTNSFSVAVALSANPSFAVHCAPGLYDPHEDNVTGPDTLAYLDRFNINWAVIGASGVTGKGPNEAQAGGAAVKRAMLCRAERNMLLADHSKFGRVKLQIICPLSDIQFLVSDQRPTGALAAALDAARVEILDASTNGA